MSKKKPTVTKPVNLGPVAAPAKKPRAPAKKAESKIKKAIPESVGQVNEEFSENNRKPSLPSATAGEPVNFCIKFADQAESQTPDDTQLPGPVLAHSHRELATEWFGDTRIPAFRFVPASQEWIRDFTPAWDPNLHYALHKMPADRPMVSYDGCGNKFPEPLKRMVEGATYWVADLVNLRSIRLVADASVDVYSAGGVAQAVVKLGAHPALAGGLLHTTMGDADLHVSAYIEFLDWLQKIQANEARPPKHAGSL